MPNPMLMSPDMGGVSGGGNTNTNNSQVSQLANTLGLNTSGPNSTGPLVSDELFYLKLIKKELFFGYHRI